MTKEEAVNRFKGIRKSFSISIAQVKFYPSKVILDELCDMAIEALTNVQNMHNSDLISREDAIEAWDKLSERGRTEFDQVLMTLPSADAEKKKAELKENGDWDCPDVYCDECDHHRSVEWCSLAIPNHEENIDETYKMVNEAFFEGFDAAEKQYRFLIETVEELDKKLADAEHGWIPVSERLPSERGWYLITVQDVNRFTDMDYYYGNSEWDEVSSKQEVIAWMPLPKPYKESEDKE